MPTSQSRWHRAKIALFLSLVLQLSLFARAECHQIVFACRKPIGELYDQSGKETDLGPAAGKIDVPNGARVVLKLSRGAINNPECLKQLKPDDIWEIDFSRTTVQDSWLQNIKHLKGLKRIDLSYTRVTDGCSEQLAKIPALDSIDLRYTAFSGSRISQLKSIPKLREIILAGNKLDRKLFDGVLSLKALQALDLDYCVLSEDSTGVKSGLKSLVKLRSLQLLGLSGWKTDARSLDFLKELPSLRTLRLSSSSVDDECLRGMHSPIESLNLDYASKITDASIVHLNTLKHLRSLKLSHTKLTAGALNKLRLPGLDTLSIAGTHVGQIPMTVFKQMKDMRELDLLGTECGDNAVSSMTGMFKLQKLVLCNTRITDAAIPLLTGLHNLRVLDVSNTNISEAGYHKLQAALPKATIIWD